MPRGIYDRSKARRRTTRRTTNNRAKTSSLSMRIEQLSRELASLAQEVKNAEVRPDLAENLQTALNQYMLAQGAGAGASTPAATTTGRRRGRPPGSKNRPKNEADGATAAPARHRPGRPKGSKNRPKTAMAEGTARRGPGRPRKNPAMLGGTSAPRRRGRPRKTAQPASA